MPVEITCKRCGAKKMVKPYQVDLVNGNYCSRSCMGKDRVGDKNPFFGKTHTDASKAQNSKSCMGRNGPDNSFYGKTHTDETKEKISEKQKENFEDPEYQERFHESRVKMWEDPTYRENIIEARKKYRATDETKELKSDIAKKLWEDPEYRKILTEKRKEVWEDPEYSKLRSDAMKKMWESEEYKTNVLTPLREVMRRPEYREKMSIIMSGDKTHLWKGGISEQPYHKSFNEEFRERVREFFGRRCFDCGMDEKENGVKLSVHHLDEDKSICGDGSELSYVPLCISCHRYFHVGDNNIVKKKEYVDKLIDVYNGRCYYTKEEFYKN